MNKFSLYLYSLYLFGGNLQSIRYKLLGSEVVNWLPYFDIAKGFLDHF